MSAVVCPEDKSTMHPLSFPRRRRGSPPRRPLCCPREPTPVHPLLKVRSRTRRRRRLTTRRGRATAADARLGQCSGMTLTLDGRGRIRLGSARLTWREFVAGGGASNRTAHQSAPTHWEWGKHVHAAMTTHVGSWCLPVVRCPFGESPDSHSWSLHARSTRFVERYADDHAPFRQSLLVGIAG